MNTMIHLDALKWSRRSFQCNDGKLPMAKEHGVAKEHHKSVKRASRIRISVASRRSLQGWHDRRPQVQKRHGQMGYSCSGPETAPHATRRKERALLQTRGIFASNFKVVIASRRQIILFHAVSGENPHKALLTGEFVKSFFLF